MKSLDDIKKKWLDLFSQVYFTEIFKSIDELKKHGGGTKKLVSSDDLLDEAYNLGIDNALSVIPEEKLESWIVNTIPIVDEKAVSFNFCCSQVIENIKKLKI